MIPFRHLSLAVPTGEKKLRLRHLGTARTGAYFSLAPFVGAFLAIPILGEAVTPNFLMGAFLMGIGVWLHLTECHQHGTTTTHWSTITAMRMTASITGIIMTITLATTALTAIRTNIAMLHHPTRITPISTIGTSTERDLPVKRWNAGPRSIVRTDRCRKQGLPMPTPPVPSRYCGPRPP